jgi:polar amino acid transport system substrate-binding protein
VKKEPTVQELEASREQLLKSIRLLDPVTSSGAPDVLKRLDVQFVKELMGGSDLPWGDEGLYPDTARFLAALRRSEPGRRMCLASDVEVLKKVLETGADQPHRGPFDLVETLFPVRVAGRPVHVIWSGKVREKPFTADECAEVARLSGLPKTKVEALARGVPVLSRKQMERAMAFCRRLRDAMEMTLAEHGHAGQLTQQLMQSERTRSVGTLSGGVAHHFNNLLSVILGYSSFVLNREQLSREASDALKQIMDSAQRGRRLTEEILAFVGSDTEEEAPCRVHETIGSVLSLLESKTGSSVKVDTQLVAEHDTVMAQPSSIRQIVFNLLTNAIDSMPSGGVLSVATSNTSLVTDTGQGEYLKIRVSDTSGTTGAKTKGGEPDMAGNRISLKLSSVYGMVGRMEGTVVVASEPGASGRVEVLLPVVAAAGRAHEEKKIRRRLAPSQIWVVDDDAIFREMCRQVLSDEGHKVKELNGGREFHDAWRKGADRPDLILMDFSMPEYNGLQLCEWLKNEGSHVPVILVSGFTAHQPDIRKALRLKRTFFLQKPFSFREMADTVTVALGETFIGE